MILLVLLWDKNFEVKAHIFTEKVVDVGNLENYNKIKELCIDDVFALDKYCTSIYNMKSFF